jgi:hypothetical protein
VFNVDNNNNNNKVAEGVPIRRIRNNAWVSVNEVIPRTRVTSQCIIKDMVG